MTSYFDFYVGIISFKQTQKKFTNNYILAHFFDHHTPLIKMKRSGMRSTCPNIPNGTVVEGLEIRKLLS